MAPVVHSPRRRRSRRPLPRPRRGRSLSRHRGGRRRPGRQRRGQDQPAASLRRPAAVTSGEARCSGSTSRTDHTAVRRHVGLLGHAAPLYDELDRGGERPLRRAGPRPADRDRPTPALERLGLAGRLRATAGRPALGRPAPPGGPGRAGGPPPRAVAARRAARRARRHGPRTCWRDLVAEAVADGAAVLLSSHEPELAVPLADRVVVMAGGRVTGERAGRPSRPAGRRARGGTAPDRATTGASHVA